jgi:hypothetical protein
MPHILVDSLKFLQYRVTGRLRILPISASRPPLAQTPSQFHQHKRILSPRSWKADSSDIFHNRVYFLTAPHQAADFLLRQDYGNAAVPLARTPAPVMLKMLMRTINSTPIFITHFLISEL